MASSRASRSPTVPSSLHPRPQRAPSVAGDALAWPVCPGLPAHDAGTFSVSRAMPARALYLLGRIVRLTWAMTTLRRVNLHCLTDFGVGYLVVFLGHHRLDDLWLMLFDARQ